MNRERYDAPNPQPRISEYVAGFLIHREFNLVLLVNKLKPLWQHGKLNGIGGLIEGLCRCGHVQSCHIQGTAGCERCLQLQNILKEPPCLAFREKGRESPEQAMIREWTEEVQQVGFEREWRRMCVLEGQARDQQGKVKVILNGDYRFRVHFFRAFTKTMHEMGHPPANDRGESFQIIPIPDVNSVNAISNLPWLLQMAIHLDNDVASHFSVHEQYV